MFQESAHTTGQAFVGFHTASDIPECLRTVGNSHSIDKAYSECPVTEGTEWEISATSLSLARTRVSYFSTEGHPGTCLVPQEFLERRILHPEAVFAPRSFENGIEQIYQRSVMGLSSTGSHFPTQRRDLILSWVVLGNSPSIGKNFFQKVGSFLQAFGWRLSFEGRLHVENSSPLIVRFQAAIWRPESAH
jgi:hypothetical protein